MVTRSSDSSASRNVQPRITSHPDGITAVDTEYFRPGLAACHIVREGAHAAIVDIGTNSAVPLVLAALDSLGLSRSAVEYVFLTHVHLDHAGGAGALLEALPQARAVLHPRGAPHLIDPARLVAASIAVYGEAQYRALYGEIKPLPSERVITMHDGQRIELGARPLLLIDTPGHALHHYCLVDLAHDNVFTGDTFGLSYRELDTERGAFILPTTTPTQFDPEQLTRSIDRLLSYHPKAAYLMHYSRVTDVARLGAELKEQIAALVALARAHAHDADRAAALARGMRALYLERARRHGITLPEATLDAILAMDFELNVQGLIAWLDRTARRA